MKYIVLMASLIAFAGCERKAADVKTEKGRLSYTIGQQIGGNLKSQGLDIDSATLAESISHALQGKPSLMSQEDMQKTIQGLQQAGMEKRKVEGEANLKKGTEFLEANAKKEGVKVTASGLQYKVVTEGKGPKPKNSDTVKVHYKGTLVDGTKFDSSYDRNQPAQFPVNAVIPGWTEALQLMPVGSKWELFIPSKLAYGEMGRPGIPGNSALLFEVELLDIEKPTKK